ncbi:MAG TPA: SCO family protein [Rhodanobacteraceae bacterium]|nr:SCO family protein [Rhodanobacteraceae bacterium]
MKRAVCLVCAWLLPLAASARALPPPPDLAQRAGFDQRLGAQVPMDLQFRGSDGRRVSLATLVRGRPMLLALGYYDCPNLCGAVLLGMAQSAAAMPLRPGRDYEAVFVSIDPRDTPATAARKQAAIARAVPDAHVGAWHFLTGDPAAVHALAQAVGFRYFYDKRNDQFAHAAGVVVLSGKGRVAQYMFGVRYPPRSLRLALVDASAGHLGSLVDQLVLLCCGYDPTTGRYSLLVGRVMQVFGVGFALLLAAMLGWLFRRGRRRRREVRA